MRAFRSPIQNLGTYTRSQPRLDSPPRRIASLSTSRLIGIFRYLLSQPNLWGTEVV